MTADQVASAWLLIGLLGLFILAMTGLAWLLEHFVDPEDDRPWR